MFTFNDEYLLKSMMSLVHEESDRIVSLGLTTREELKGFVEPELRFIVEKFSGDNKQEILMKIAKLHDKLNSIRLPGDFEGITEIDHRRLMADLNIEDEPIKEAETEPIIDEQPVVEEISNDHDKLHAVCSFLSDLSYNLGKSGNHEAAYLVERAIYKIEGLVKK